LLFASFHAQVWPSPIPLFFLGLGLGWLSYRTQSLIGPIVAHALFNAVACIVLALE
jgi:membrane protease YdiL (CAAX protease family)